MRIGDLVLLAEDNQTPLQWKPGRIQKTYPGNDGNVRKVKVKTSGQLSGPVAMLRKLPLSARAD